VRERLEPKDFCPAAGQGSLGIESRKDDRETIAAVAFLDNAATRFAVTAERAALAALGGGCQVPIGIYCRVGVEPGTGGGEEPWDEVFGVVAAPETGSAVRIYRRAVRGEFEPAGLGRLAARMLIEAGAGPLLEAQGEVSR
jgi:hydroxymethylbilane synthase